MVTQLWKLFENSPKRLACYLKAQEQLKNLQLSNEKSRKMVAKKLKKACDTRWLSFNSAIQSLYADLVAVLQTLKQLKKDPGQPAAYGLLKKINGPVPHTEACDSLVSKAVNMWKAAKKRKLPYDRPSTQPEANSETEAAIPTTVVQDMGTQTDATSTTELQNI